MFLKYIIFPTVVTMLLGAQGAVAGVAPASVFDMAEQYRPDRIRNVLKNEAAGASLSPEESVLLNDYRADEKAFKELQSKVRCVCSDNERATSYKYAEDPLPDCKTISPDLLKQAKYVATNGSHYIVSPENHAKMQERSNELNRKWSE